MLLLFDYDGVIANSFDSLLKVCIEAQVPFAEGRAPTPHDFRTIENLTFVELGNVIGIPASKCASYAAKVFEIQQKQWQACPFPEVVPVILKLATQNTIAVVTNSQSHIVAAALNGFGLGDAITTVVGGESGATKVERITHLQRACATDDDCTYMIGDTVGDIRAGKQAGVQTIAVTWGFQDRDLLQQEAPDHLLDHPEALLFIGSDDCEITL